MGRPKRTKDHNPHNLPLVTGQYCRDCGETPGTPHGLSCGEVSVEQFNAALNARGGAR